jgi:hypothetical protein
MTGSHEINVRAVERLIWLLHRDGGAAEYREDPFGVLDARCAELLIDGAARRLLAERDYRALIDAGVHPMATLFFSQVNQLPMPLYLEQIGASAERVQEFKDGFQRVHGSR